MIEKICKTCGKPLERKQEVTKEKFLRVYWECPDHNDTRYGFMDDPKMYGNYHSLREEQYPYSYFALQDLELMCAIEAATTMHKAAVMRADGQGKTRCRKYTVEIETDESENKVGWIAIEQQE